MNETADFFKQNHYALVKDVANQQECIEALERIFTAKEQGKGTPKGDGQCLLSPSFYGEFDYMMADKKELFEDATECFEQSFNANRKCKDKYGELSFAKSIISDNCNPGYIRAICANNSKQ